ncbi:MAG: hypothetical protein IKD83_04175, partial [Firmicutes bacterium]|nr:hypothetical protein [Bacillota bacterium]
MKKKLAILLSAVMVAGVIPMTALAGTTTYVNKTVTVEKGDTTNEESLVVIKDGNDDIAASSEDQTFTMTLEGAEWLDEMENIKEGATPAKYDVTGIASVVKAGDKKVTVTIDAGASEKYYRIPLFTKITDKGDITVTVDGKDSLVSSATCVYAVCTSGAATAKIEKTVNIPETGAVIKDITISETTAGAIDRAKKIELKLNKNFKFTDCGSYIPVLGDDFVDYIEIDPTNNKKIIIHLDNTVPVKKATEFIISGIEVTPDDAKIGAVAEITVSGADVTKTTFEAGTYTDYGVKIAIYDEDEEIPTF